MNKNDIINYLTENKEYLKQKFNIKSLGLYGSYARDEQTDNSDIDICYELIDDNKFGYFDFLEIEKILAGHFNKKIELVNLKYMNPIIKLRAEKELIYV